MSNSFALSSVIMRVSIIVVCVCVCNAVDIDECERNVSLCNGGICENTDGSYKCVCPPGHQLSVDGSACEGENQNHTSLLFFHHLQKYLELLNSITLVITHGPLLELLEAL